MWTPELDLLMLTYPQEDLGQITITDDPDDHEFEVPSPPSGCEIVCPDDPEDQYLPNPTDCSSFFQCSNGLPYLQPCPRGLVFDRNLKVCNYPEDAPACHPVDCSEFHPGRVAKDKDKEPTVCKRHACPLSGESLQPDPFNCHAYFKCSDGLGVVQRCKDPEDVFSPEEGKCVGPDDYKCKVRCHQD